MSSCARRTATDTAPGCACSMKGGPGAAQPAAINARVTATPKRLSMCHSFEVDRGLPMERHAECGAVQLERRPRIVIKLVIDVAPHADQLAPAERVAEAPVQLVRVLRLTAADVSVIRHEPFAPVAERDPPLGADDRVPVVEA